MASISIKQVVGMDGTTKVKCLEKKRKTKTRKVSAIFKDPTPGEDKTTSLEGDTWNVSSSFPKIKRKRVELDEKKEANHIL